MANKKIKYEDIADRGLLEPLIKEVKELNELLGRTEANLKANVKAAAALAESKPLENYEDAQDVADAVDDVKDSVDELTKIEKQRAKLQERLAELNDEEIKQNFKLREEIRLRTKALRDEAKAALEHKNSYQKLAAATNEAQAQFKKLAAQHGINSKEAKKALKNFKDLDDKLREIDKTARDGRRNVGRYRESLEGLNDTLENLQKVSIVLELLSLGAELFSGNSEGAATFQKSLEAFTLTVQKLADRVVLAFGEIDRRLKMLLIRVQIVGEQVKGFFDFIPTIVSKIANGIADVASLFGPLGSAISDIASKIATDISDALRVNTEAAEDESAAIVELRKQYKELADKEGLDLTTLFDGITTEISSTISANNELIDTTLKYRKEIVALEKANADLLVTQADLNEQADNDTLSLREQIEARVKLNAVNEKIEANNVAIAQKRFKLAADNAKIYRTSIEAQEELALATTELGQAEADQLESRREGLVVLGQLRSDQIEQNLDFLIDDFDNQKSINERIIADETQTFEKRRALLEETERLAAQSYENQKAELNSFLTAQGKAELDFDKLIAEKDSAEIARIVEEAGLREQLGVRGLEILKERRLAIQDLVEAQRDLTAEEQASAEAQADLELTNKALLDLNKENVDVQGVLNQLAADRLDQEIVGLRSRIALAKEGSEQRIELERELNEKLLQQQQQRLKKEADAEAAARKRRNDNLVEGLETTKEIVNEILDERIGAIDKEIEAEERRAEKAEELAENGNETAKENLAKSQKRQAELARAREQEVRRQELAELALATVTTYQQKVAAGDKNAFASTITDISLLKAFVSSLNGFFEGTENTGTAGFGLYDEHGAITGYTHSGERVMTAAQNRMVGNMSNIELAMLAQAHRTPDSASIASGSNPALIHEIRQLRSVMDNKPVYMGADFDAKQEAIVHSVLKKGRLERKHVKTGGIWGKPKNR